MCFTIYSNSKPKPEKATKDITVYKSIKKNGFGVYNSLKIKDVATPWEEGYEHIETTPFAGMRVSFFDKRKWNIYGHAFHSCITIKAANGHMCGDGSTMIVKMIIPKGALYFKNGQEYVSSRIIYPKQKQIV